MTSSSGDGMPCPSCHVPLTIDPGCAVWCAACGWGLPDAARRGWVGRLAARLETVGATGPATPTRVLLRLVTWLTAVLVHAVTIALVLLAWSSLRSFGHGVVGLLFGGGFLALAGYVAPWRRLRAAAPSFPVTDLAATRDLLGELATLLSAPAPRAAAWTIGAAAQDAVRDDEWRRRVLQLPLPAWAVSDAAAKLALLTHEVARQRDGDPRHGPLVRAALVTLERWIHLFTPLPPPDTARHLAGRAPTGRVEPNSLHRAFQPVIEVALWVLRIVPRAARGVLLLASLPLTRRAQLHGDVRTAGVVGTDATKAMIEAGVTWDPFAVTLRRATLFDEGDAWATAVARVRSLPAGERRRLLRADDRTHDPMGPTLSAWQRWCAVDALPWLPPRVELDSARGRQLDDELETTVRPARLVVSDELVERAG